jgi:hypothetical protein
MKILKKGIQPRAKHAAQARSVLFDVMAIAMVVFLLTTVSCWVKMKRMKSSPTPPTIVQPLLATSTISCETRKTMYDRAYVDALHPITSSVDWDALDKAFYANHKECI